MTGCSKHPHVEPVIQQTADRIALIQENGEHPGYGDEVATRVVEAIAHAVDGLDVPSFDEWVATQPVAA